MEPAHSRLLQVTILGSNRDDAYLYLVVDPNRAHISVVNRGHWPKKTHSWEAPISTSDGHEIFIEVRRLADEEQDRATDFLDGFSVKLVLVELLLDGTTKTRLISWLCDNRPNLYRYLQSLAENPRR